MGFQQNVKQHWLPLPDLTHVRSRLAAFTQRVRGEALEALDALHREVSNIYAYASPGSFWASKRKVNGFLISFAAGYGMFEIYDIKTWESDYDDPGFFAILRGSTLSKFLIPDSISPTHSSREAEPDILRSSRPPAQGPDYGRDAAATALRDSGVDGRCTDADASGGNCGFEWSSEKGSRQSVRDPARPAGTCHAVAAVGVGLCWTNSNAVGLIEAAWTAAGRDTRSGVQAIPLGLLGHCHRPAGPDVLSSVDPATGECSSRGLRQVVFDARGNAVAPILIPDRFASGIRREAITLYYVRATNAGWDRPIVDTWLC